MNKFFTAKRLCRAGVIAALYVALTYAFGALSYQGVLQIRPAEALCVLPLLFPEAVPALYVGCMLANLASPFFVYDVLLGSLVTLVASLITYTVGRCVKNLPLKIGLGGLAPVALNALIIPLIIVFLCGDTAGRSVAAAYWTFAASLCLTEAVWVYGLGLPVFLTTLKMQKKGTAPAVVEKKKSGKKKPFLFKTIVFFVRIFYRKRRFSGLENLPSESAVIVGNHAQMHGPLTYELFYPRKKYIWCTGEMMRVREIPAYAYEDFWSKKPKATRWFFKICSYLIAPFSYLFNRADTIGVYRDARLRRTFSETLKGLDEGADIVIFPEGRTPFNGIVNEFQDKFVDVAKLYYRKTGKALCFVPAYNAPRLKTVAFGKPVVFDPEREIGEERARVCEYLKAEITALAKGLPRHKVLPYDNVGRKKYCYSDEIGERE